MVDDAILIAGLFRAAVRAAVADWSVRSARIDAQVRDLATAARQWMVAGTPAARDVVARGCHRLADAVDAHTTAEERDLLPWLDAHLGAGRWAAIASAWAARRAPASVGVTPEEERSSSRVPTSFSSAARCWETAGWVHPSSRAPAPIEPLRTTVRKMSSLRGSMRPW